MLRFFANNCQIEYRRNVHARTSSRWQSQTLHSKWGSYRWMLWLLLLLLWLSMIMLMMMLMHVTFECAARCEYYVRHTNTQFSSRSLEHRHHRRRQQRRRQNSVCFHPLTLLFCNQHSKLSLCGKSRDDANDRNPIAATQRKAKCRCTSQRSQREQHDHTLE